MYISKNQKKIIAKINDLNLLYIFKKTKLKRNYAKILCHNSFYLFLYVSFACYFFRFDFPYRCDGKLLFGSFVKYIHKVRCEFFGYCF